MTLVPPSSTKITGSGAAGAITADRPALLRARARNFARSFAPFVKRTLDIVVASIVLALSLPILILAVVAVKLESSGPAFFCQRRVGERGKTFRLFKIRSMFQDAERRRKELEREHGMCGGIRFKLDRDPRIT
ncbi:MAG: sugar transferase, partial [Holophagales bacterium]|nr:sugar transferase [Holophagales bacterium]